MNAVKKSLFVGALLGAGLCSSAIAGEFLWTDGTGDFHVLTAGGREGDDDLGNSIPAAGMWSADAGNRGVSSLSSGGLFGMSMSMSVNQHQGGFTASGSAVFSFQVSTAMDALLIWDFAGGLGHSGQNNFINIFNSDTGDPLASFNSDRNASGQIVLENLAAGQNYVLETNLQSWGGISSFSMTESAITVVPLPPAGIAGLGLLGCMAVKRRLRK